MYRKFVAITMFVSFVAMSTSGLLMFFIARPSFTLQMHPVHKVFGLVLVLAASAAYMCGKHFIVLTGSLLRHLIQRQ